MSETVAVVAQGAMGAGTGAALVKGGARVVTSVEGRSSASAARAAEAGMEAVSDATLVEADLILSIVPPGEALAFAQRMAPHLKAASRKPVFADMNAVSPQTVALIAEVIAQTGAPFADGGIIGGPPKAGYEGPAFYCSGPAAEYVSVLSDHGLDIRIMDGPVGAASALKMSYAGITKGLTALSSMMMLAATRAGADRGLASEVAESQPDLTAWFGRQTPGMYAKAYRWVAEMREIADFVRDDPAAAKLFEAAAEFYERMAADHAGDQRESAALSAFLKEAKR
jgi:3-hydroxyisobutyrate dehydrogenase-like beta-hydroxyacid dehydrogenase